MAEESSGSSVIGFYTEMAGGGYPTVILSDGAVWRICGGSWEQNKSVPGSQSQLRRTAEGLGEWEA